MESCRSLLIWGFVAVLLTAGCTTEDVPGHEAGVGDQVTLTVFSAASLAGAFTAISASFQDRHPGVEVVLNLAGSQQLAQQLRHGAPGDVFASADREQMLTAVEAGRIQPESPRIFARNRLVVVVPITNPADLRALQDLAKPGLRLVLAAEEVPAGRYARVFLERASMDAAYSASYAEQVLNRVVSFEQNVRSVLTKVTLGEADAGIVYTSDLTGADAERIARIEIPEVFNKPAEYLIAPISGSGHLGLAEAFVDFVCSPDGQEILMQYGFSGSNHTSFSTQLMQ